MHTCTHAHIHTDTHTHTDTYTPSFLPTGCCLVVCGRNVELQQQLWEAVLAFERKNPLKLEHDFELVERVFFVYSQYLLCFSRYPTCVHPCAEACWAERETKNQKNKANAVCLCVRVCVRVCVCS